MFVVTYIVETRGRTLEETAALFDGEQPTQDLTHRGGEAATTGMGMGEVQVAENKQDSIIHSQFLELRNASVQANSEDDLSVHSPIDHDRKQAKLYRISELSDA